ncbi:MAG: Uncharacterized protein XD97_0245, partial [Pelotomaculum thermopropionicum]
MEVRVAAKAGFCFGVKRAMEMALDTVLKKEGPIFSLGLLIHNPQAVEYLAKKGIKEINDLDEINEGTLIIRSHGVGPGSLHIARDKGLDIVDATCPFVRRAQVLASDLISEGYQVVVVGDRKHPEVQGIIGWTAGKAIVVENAEEAVFIDQYRKIGVVAQTTQPLENFEAVIKVISERNKEVRACNTICSATSERQQAASELARQVDAMVVVGGKNSANTRKLFSLCSKSGTPTFLVETAGELNQAWFQGVKVVGLTAGASTPDWIIEEVKSRMSEFEEMNNREEGMEEAVEVKAVRNGQVLKGMVVHVGQDEVMVDVGAKSEGVIPIRELSCC